MVACLISLSARAGEIAAPRAGTELFVDDVNIAKMEHVTRHTHAATKLEQPVLQPDRPWEGKYAAYIYGTVVREAGSGLFRMWYGSSGDMLYATSRDGVAWEKPALDGAVSNIVLHRSSEIAVLVDSAEPDPARRYKALVARPIREGGFMGYVSADGLHWQPCGDGPFFTAGSEMAHLVRDPVTRKYIAYIRPYVPRYFPKSNHQKRLGAVLTSDDFAHWTEPRVVLEPDAADDAWVGGKDQRTEFYAMNGFPYGRSWLGIVPLFRITQILESKGHDQSLYDGFLEGQLITSRDGLQWSRMKEREPVIPSGPAFDQSIMNVASAPVIVGDEVWHYYTGISGSHGAPVPPKRITVCLAKWRLDGFVSLDTGEEEGVVETTTIADRTGRLEVNADASRGWIKVEVLGREGGVLPGYEAVMVTGDQVHAIVVAQLPAGEFRLRFWMKKAALFSYTIGK